MTEFIGYDPVVTKNHSVKLIVYVGKRNSISKKPILVVMDGRKTINALKLEFETRKSYRMDEQHWIISGKYCFDEFLINEFIDKDLKTKKGYVGILNLLTEEEKNGIMGYFVNYLEDRYQEAYPNCCTNPPYEETIVIADNIDPIKVKDMCWTCDACTLKNKPYIMYCQICLNSRPLNYTIPEGFYLLPEDKEFIRKENERYENELKMKGENKKKYLEKKNKDLKYLRSLYTEKDIVYAAEEIECPICCDTFGAGQGLILRSCHHTICKNCLHDHVVNAADPKINCPCGDCVGVIEDKEIQGVLTKEEFDNYQALNLRTARQGTKNTFNCKTANCKYWVVFDDNINMFLCPLCKLENCISCGAIHTNMNCEQYQEDLKIRARNDEAARKDLEFLQGLIDRGEAMNCPGCKIIIQKTRGCDGMRCNMCKIEICWATKGPRWGPKGRGDTTGGCICRVNNVRCTPTVVIVIRVVVIQLEVVNVE